MTLQEYLVQYRRRNGLSQRQFAERCGLSNGYISMLESGKNPASGKPLAPQLPALAKIAAGMNLTLTALLQAVDNLSVESDREVVHASELALTKEEVDLVLAYRGAPDKQKKVQRLLGLPSGTPFVLHGTDDEPALRVADGTTAFGDGFFQAKDT